jgi:uncharacterized protein
MVDARMESVSEIAERLIARIRSFGPVAVAFSGGVDSAVVAKAAMLALGSDAVAITAVSPSLAVSERLIAQQEALRIGIRHLEIETTEFQREEYRRNASDRCFYCKDTLYSVTEQGLSRLNVQSIINGANLDDLGDHRPGMKAAAEHQVRSPLIDEQIGKRTVRELARYWNLSVAEKPASPCLASRIAYGIEVTESRVAMIELAESLIRELTGLQVLRVRLESNELARIEVPLSDLPLLIQNDTREQITAGLKAMGFRSVTIDLEGFRSGNLNSSLPMVKLQIPKTTIQGPSEFQSHCLNEVQSGTNLQ